MASARRRKRAQYSDKQRQLILAAAAKGRLTALQVQKKFGVVPVTYYSWRKKMGLTRLRRRNGQLGQILMSDSMKLKASVQDVVRKRMIAIMPNIVRREVNDYLNALFVNANGGRRPRR